PVPTRRSSDLDERKVRTPTSAVLPNGKCRAIGRISATENKLLLVFWEKRCNGEVRAHRSLSNQKRQGKPHRVQAYAGRAQLVAKRPGEVLELRCELEHR